MTARDQRIAVAGCVTALAGLVPVALYQSKLIDSLPDPPGEIFNSNRITSSKAAHPLGVPDSYPGLASYVTTLTLVLLARKSGAAKRLLGAKATLDGLAAAGNATRQVVSFGKLCSWCTLTALATTLVVYGSRDAIAETGCWLKEQI